MEFRQATELVLDSSGVGVGGGNCGERRVIIGDGDINHSKNNGKLSIEETTRDIANVSLPYSAHLPRRSLTVLSGPARYSYTHAIGKYYFIKFLIIYLHSLPP